MIGRAHAPAVGEAHARSRWKPAAPAGVGVYKGARHAGHAGTEAGRRKADRHWPATQAASRAIRAAAPAGTVALSRRWPDAEQSATAADRLSPGHPARQGLRSGRGDRRAFRASRLAQILARRRL